MTTDFSDKIDAMIADLTVEIGKVRKARTKPKTHVNFVTQEMNDLIKRLSSKNPDDPVKTLGTALSRIGETIENSFERLDTIEGNIVVAIQSYQRVKDAYIAHQNEAMQVASESPEESEQDNSGIRKPGTRPEDKLASRRKKEVKDQPAEQEKPKKRSTRKRKTSKSKKEK